MRRVVRCADADALARQATELFVEAAAEAASARGRFVVALAGGSTPERMYRMLAELSWSERVPWERLTVLFGDERMVPADDARSNYGMARRALLDHVPIPREQVHAVPTIGNTPDAAAEAYERAVAAAMGAEIGGPPPAIDLVLLGMGEDGHTASLFPHAEAVHVADRWVAWSPPGVLPPLVDRVTMTFSLLNAARRVIFLVSGEAKAETLRDVLEDTPACEQRPAACVRPTAGELVWLVDEAAATLL